VGEDRISNKMVIEFGCFGPNLSEIDGMFASAQRKPRQLSTALTILERFCPRNLCLNLMQLHKDEDKSDSCLEILGFLEEYCFTTLAEGDNHTNTYTASYISCIIKCSVPHFSDDKFLALYSTLLDIHQI
jgi:hypothetical protein